MLDISPSNWIIDDDKGIPDPARMEILLRELMRGVNDMFLKSMGNVVRHGPFKGMIIPIAEEESWADGNFSTKILGCYEHELHDAITYAVSRNPKMVINIGCGDGYYAIGLARMIQSLKVYAYDINPLAVDVCLKYSKLNSVADRIEASVGRPMGLKSDEDKILFVIDCEGDELSIVDLKLSPRMARADIIVECHDFLDSNISLILADRLSKTHAIEIIRARLPLFGRYEFLNQSPGIMQVLAVTEKRPMPTLWLACWAHQRGD